MLDTITLTSSALASIVSSTAFFDAVAGAQSALASISAQTSALSDITIIK